MYTTIRENCAPIPMGLRAVHADDKMLKSRKALVCIRWSMNILYIIICAYSGTMPPHTSIKPNVPDLDSYLQKYVIDLLFAEIIVEVYPGLFAFCHSAIPFSDIHINIKNLRVLRTTTSPDTFVTGLSRSIYILQVYRSGIGFARYFVFARKTTPETATNSRMNC